MKRSCEKTFLIFSLTNYCQSQLNEPWKRCTQRKMKKCRHHRGSWRSKLLFSLGIKINVSVRSWEWKCDTKMKIIRCTWIYFPPTPLVCLLLLSKNAIKYDFKRHLLLEFYFYTYKLGEKYNEARIVGEGRVLKWDGIKLLFSWFYFFNFWDTWEQTREISSCFILLRSSPFNIFF